MSNFLPYYQTYLATRQMMQPQIIQPQPQPVTGVGTVGVPDFLRSLVALAQAQQQQQPPAQEPRKEEPLPETQIVPPPPPPPPPSPAPQRPAQQQQQQPAAPSPPRTWQEILLQHLIQPRVFGPGIAPNPGAEAMRMLLAALLAKRIPQPKPAASGNSLATLPNTTRLSLYNPMNDFFYG